MTEKTQREIVKKLFLKDSKLFFKKIDSISETDNIEKEFFILYEDSGLFYVLKDEFRELLKELSLSEILQIIDSNEIKTIRKWITFFGIVLIIQIVIGIIVGIIIVTH